MSPLEFANSMGWWWLAAGIPIIAVYSLKVRLRQVPTSTFLFWNSVFDEKPPRAWWQRLRHWLSLALQLLMLVLVVAAISDPLWSWQKRQARTMAIVVDNSASMAVTELGGSRLYLARQKVSSIIRSMRDGDRMAIIAAATPPRVVVGLTGHTATLLRSLETISQTDCPEDHSTAIQLARRSLPSIADGQVILISDQPPTENQTLPSTHVNVGTPQDNLAITRFQVRRSFRDNIAYAVLIEVTNYGTFKANLQVELTLDGELIDVQPVDLPPGQSQTLHIEQNSVDGGILQARLATEDALPIDNIARAVLPGRGRTPVELYSRGNLFVSRVLEAIPLVDLQSHTELPESWGKAANSIRVFYRMTPIEIPDGRLLVIQPDTHSDLWTLGDPLESPLVDSVLKTTPLTANLQLSNTLFPGARQLQATPENAIAAIRSISDDPLLLHIPRSSGDVIVLNVDLDQSDLPLKIAFPVLMKNSLEFLMGLDGELTYSVPSGQVASVRLPPSQREVNPQREEQDDPTSPEINPKSSVKETSIESETRWLLTSPSGKRIECKAHDGHIQTDPLTECGLWTLRPSAVNEDTPLIQLACNLSNRRESDLRGETEAGSSPPNEILAGAGRPIWFYLAVLATFLATGEWWLYQRRLVG